MVVPDAGTRENRIHNAWHAILQALEMLAARLLRMKEVRVGLQRVTPNTDAQLMELFERIDVAHKGSITEAEFAAIVAADTRAARVFGARGDGWIAVPHLGHRERDTARRWIELSTGRS